MWGFIVAVSCNLVTHCEQSIDLQKNARLSDTNICFQKKTTLITGITPTVMPVVFNPYCYLDKNNSHTLLILEKPVIFNNPEGVLELYFSRKMFSAAAFRATDSSFISLIDLYTLTAPDAKQEIAIDITAVLNKNGQPRRRWKGYFYIRFDGLTLPGGKKSTAAGKIQFSGYKIIRVAAR